VIYLFGLAWLAFGFSVIPASDFVGIGLSAALLYGLYPFLLGDAMKAALATLLLPSAWKLIGKNQIVTSDE
jgi:biotin transport system substrate-specific component